MGLGVSTISEQAFSTAKPLWVGDEFAEKRRKLRAASPAALTVLSDFDRTLTSTGAPECHDIVGLHSGATMRAPAAALSTVPITVAMRDAST